MSIVISGDSPNLTSANLTTPIVTTTMGVGGATPAASGSGITFPATQSASTDANTLDDYEEGTWTPVFASRSGSITSYQTYGYYVKTGRIVNCLMCISITNGGTASGVMDFSNLPFTTLNPTALTYGANRVSTFCMREDGATGNFYFGYVSPNTTTGVVTSSTNGALTWTTGYAYVASFAYETA